MTNDELSQLLTQRNNWGRWGADDERGAINLITPEKRARAASFVRSGRAVSLSRDLPTVPGPGNPTPAQHFFRIMGAPGGIGGVVDHIGLVYHGYQTTHIDALCHVWSGDGMWNGRDPAVEVTSTGARFGSIGAWRDGIVTRGVLLDVPKFRSEPCISLDRPVTRDELNAIAKAEGVTLEPGDAVIVYSGRAAWQRQNPAWSGYAPPSPGLDPDCLAFLRDHDVAVLVWDLMDAVPNANGMALPVHAAIYAFGVALVDNALLEPLAEACAQESRYEFMLTVAPLPIPHGTGSPANPIALF